MSQIVAEMFSKIQSHKITTVVFDTRGRLLYGSEFRCLRDLDVVLASRSFSGLSTILVRVEYEWLKCAPPYINDRDGLANRLYKAFQFARARGTLEVRHHDSYAIWEAPDGCWSCRACVGLM
jgi:hypothetical protein